MKIKSFLAMMIASAALAVGLTACSDDDDDDDNVPAATSLSGTYSGDLSITVMGSETTSEASYIINKVDDNTVSLVLPASTYSSSMSMPSLTVDNIPVTKTTVAGVETITGSVESVSGTITVNEEEKSYSFSDLAIVGNGTEVSIVYTLQYGRMPMPMVCTFSGKK